MSELLKHLQLAGTQDLIFGWNDDDDEMLYVEACAFVQGLITALRNIEWAHAIVRQYVVEQPWAANWQADDNEYAAFVRLVPISAISDAEGMGAT